MALSERDVTFLEANRSAAMITVGADGRPKAARVSVGLVDGRLWSSGTADRVRTRRLRRDPRCTLYVHADTFSFMTIEATVTILDGPDAPQQSLRLFRILEDRPAGPLAWMTGELEEPAFLEAMVEERRLVYEFEVQRTYGLY
jgi:PPOX class probable F420-dependent enzyme